jgi:hypothetical protein
MSEKAGSRRTRGRRDPGNEIRRKNLNIDQAKLDRVRAILGAKNETEAVDRALALVLFRAELVQGIRSIGGSGGVENYFDADDQG